MELSRQADYAVRAMVDLAGFPAGTRVLTAEIAHRQQIPESFLPRIVAALTKSQLLLTFRGNQGGVSLARPSTEISVLEIVHAIEGPICLNRCTYQPSRCERIGYCRVHPVWRKVQNYMNQVLGETKLADLTAPVLRKQLPES